MFNIFVHIYHFFKKRTAVFIGIVLLLMAAIGYQLFNLQL